MTNTSIKAAFERMWQHVVAQVGNSKTEALNEAKAYTDEAIATKFAVQILTWEADD